MGSHPLPPSHDPFGAAPNWTGGTSGQPPIYSQQTPPTQWQPGLSQQPRPASPRGHLHWWIGGTVLAVVALVAVVVLVTVGGTDHTPARPPVATSAAPVPSRATTAPPTSTSAPAAASPGGLLLPEQDITSRMKTTMTTAGGESGSAPLNIAITPSNCSSAYAPATADGYRGAGYSELAVKGFRGPDGAASTSVVEAAAKFPDAAAAQTFYHAQFGNWASCKYTAASATYADGSSDHLKIAVPGDDGSTAIDSAFALGGRGSAGCERAMTVKAAYVIDVRVCRGATGGNAGGYGSSIAHAIARNIS